MIAKPKLRSHSNSFFRWAMESKPFSLNEVLQLRDGLELSKKNLPGLIAQKKQLKFKPIDWNSLNLN